MQLVPFNLIGDQRWDDVVDVRCAGDVHGPRVAAVIVPLASPCRSLHWLPILEATAKRLFKVLGQLSKNDAADEADFRGQPVDRLNERTSIDLWLAGPRVQRRTNVEVRAFERAQVYLA